MPILSTDSCMAKVGALSSTNKLAPRTFLELRDGLSSDDEEPNPIDTGEHPTRPRQQSFSSSLLLAGLEPSCATTFPDSPVVGSQCAGDAPQAFRSLPTAKASNEPGWEYQDTDEKPQPAQPRRPLLSSSPLWAGLHSLGNAKQVRPMSGPQCAKALHDRLPIGSQCSTTDSSKCSHPPVESRLPDARRFSHQRPSDSLMASGLDLVPRVSKCKCAFSAQVEEQSGERTS